MCEKGNEHLFVEILKTTTKKETNDYQRSAAKNIDDMTT